MFKLSVIKKSEKISVWAKKHPLRLCFEIELANKYSLYDFKLAIDEILDKKLKDELGDKYHELKDKDEAMTLANKYDKALELGLFNNFQDIINKIYGGNRNGKNND